MLAGINSIEHCTYLDDETATMMADNGTEMVLTLSVANPDPNNIPDGQEAELERLSPIFAKVREDVQKSIAIARQKGVFIGIGTDAGGNALAPHHYSMQRELEMLVEYDFTPLEALTIATKNNAKVLRMADEIGTLEVGKLADLVVLDADPLVNISNTRHINTVYKGGKAVNGTS